MAVVVWILAAAAITVRDVKLAVRAKKNAAAVMIPKRPLDGQQFALGGDVDFVVVTLAHAKLAHHTAQRFVCGIEGVEFSVLGELRMKRHAKQAFLIFHIRLAFLDVKKERGRFAVGVLR